MVKVWKTAIWFASFFIFCGLFVFPALSSWQLEFYGAVGGEVAGSCYYLTNGVEAILIDCGSHFSEAIEIGGKTERINDEGDFPFDGRKVKAIILTHAHDDHIGRLHYFMWRYPDFNGPIYMTPATWELYSADLDDTIKYSKIPEKDKQTVKMRIEKQKDTVRPLVAFSLVEGVSAYFVENGHIPGSVSVIVNIVEGEEVTTICFSGDIGPGNHPFLPDIPYRIFSMTNPDIVVIESTYGNKIRADPNQIETEIERFYRVIRESVENKKLVIIPTFALDRTQRILALLVDGIKRGKIPPNTKIAVGGKSSRSFTEKYIKMMNCEECEKMGFSKEFCEEKPLDPRFWDWVRFSTNTAQAKNYDIIVAPSGIGGSSDSKELLKAYVSDPNTVVIKVGWAPDKSPMGQIGAGKSIVQIDDKSYKVNCSVYSFHDIFSGHADQNGLLRFLESFGQLKTVIITHGNNDCRDALEKAIRTKRPGVTIFKPNYGWIFDIKTRTCREGQAHLEEPRRSILSEQAMVVIKAVLPNPRGPEPDEEWIELMNIGKEPVNLRGWYIRDNSGEYVINYDIYLAPFQSIKIYGTEYNPEGDPKGVYLSNTRDCVRLFRPTGEEVSSCCWDTPRETDEVLLCGN